MSTKYYYSPSINIIRDLDKELDYLPTSNAAQVYAQITNSFVSGTHSFNVVGSYGTGKSSFLWALEHQLNGKSNFFNSGNANFNANDGFEFLPVVGRYSSLLGSFAAIFGIDSEDHTAQDVLNKISSHYSDIHNSGKGWLIAIDEFGKFLEYAANHNPGKELYFLQQLAEFANDNSKRILLVTTLHQGFNDYAAALSKMQRNEWDKVKGRLKEITFNEPVEQLLLLASERISSRQEKQKVQSGFDGLFDCIAKSKTFPLNDYFDKAIAQKLLPFDILAASILTLSLQRYGQNERSLFQFVDSSDHLGFEDFDNQVNPYYNISCVYDYLMYNYYSILTTKHNPNYGQWATIRSSIERVEGELGAFVVDGIKLVKTVGLLNIFTHSAGIIDADFLVNYAQLSLGVKQAKEVVDKLIQFKIIGFAKYNKRFRLLDGTDLDIEGAIAEADVDGLADIIPYLREYFDFPYLQAKENFYRTGCPRFFEFKLSEKPYDKPVEEADGIINLVFSESNFDNAYYSSLAAKEPIIYCFFHNSKDVRDLLIEIERIAYVKEHHPSDKVAQRELETMLVHHKAKLNELVLENLFSENNSVTWVFDGKIIKVQSHKSLNRTLSHICDWAYPSTPTFRNELVNKTKLSGAMQPAKRNLIKALVLDSDKPNLGFADDKFPPEKTIYMALLQSTGIHNGAALAAPADPSFDALWREGLRFLEESKVARINISVLVERLQKRPFKLKQGLIDFWLPIFFFICKDDFALFDENGYVPTMDDETLILLSRQPDLFEVKAFDISGIKLELFNSYRSFLNIEESESVSNGSLIELIKPFLVFYAQLPDYNKKTRRISKQAIVLREAIALSKDPEKTFFEDFPRAMGISIERIANDQTLVKDYITTLQGLVREVRTAFEELVNRVESFIISEFIGEEVSFTEYKGRLQQRFRKLKKHMLLPKQKVFYQRLMSELDVRNAWINSICQPLLGKSLEAISDEEEKLLYENFRDYISELDNLCNLAKADIDPDKEDVFRLEITSFIKGLQKQTLRLPKGRMNELKSLETDIRGKLSSDRTTNIALLLKLLQEEIDGK